MLVRFYKGGVSFDYLDNMCLSDLLEFNKTAGDLAREEKRRKK